ncbi:MAG: transcriptional repressor [Caldiserica bacterium]|nr:MAG: transcriptional repressor [Caldisericota bacterium]
MRYRRGFRGGVLKRISRWTKSRMAILDVFRRVKGHLSADEVFLRLRKNYPNIGIATVYRNLDYLHKNGFLSRFQFGNNKASYELSERFLKGAKHHHHLICTKCGKVIDYADFIKEETDLIREMEKALSKKYGFKIQSHQLHFYGICKDCMKGGDQNAVG